MEIKFKLLKALKSRKTWAISIVTAGVFATIFLILKSHEAPPIMQCIDLEGAEIRLKVPDSQDRQAIRKACKVAGGILKKESDHG